MQQKLLTKELEKLLPPIGSTDGRNPADVKVPVKFFSPYSNWTWYCYEYDPKERIFFGLVRGFELEFGEVSLDELEAAVKLMQSGVLQLVERDAHWDPNTTLLKVKQLEGLV